MYCFYRYIKSVQQINQDWNLLFSDYVCMTLCESIYTAPNFLFFIIAGPKLYLNIVEYLPIYWHLAITHTSWHFQEKQAVNTWKLNWPLKEVFNIYI